MISHSRHSIQVILLIILIAALQHSRVLTVMGVAPNVMLALTVALAFFIDSFLLFLIMAIVAGAFIRFAPGLSVASAVFIVCAVIGYWLRRRIVQPGLVAYCITIGTASILFTILMAPGFIIRYPALFLGEVLYTMISGVLLFELIKWVRGLERV